jgi:hypothetical protein
MSGDRIDVKITVDASQAKEGFKQAEDAAQKMAEGVKTAGAKAGEGLAKPIEISQRHMREALAAAGGDVNKALKSLASVGDEAAKAGEKIIANNKGIVAELQTLGQNLAANLQTDARHLIAIFDEVQRGQRGAMIASISALARDSGALDVAIKGVGSAAVWFATTPMGQVAAAVTGIVAIIATAVAKLIELNAELRRVGGEALAMGRQPEEAAKGYEKLLGVITAQGSGGAKDIAATLKRIPRLSEGVRAALAKIAPAMLESQFGGDIKQFEKHLPGILGGPAKMTAFVERNRLLGGADLAKFLGAAHGQQAEMLVQALTTRYAPYAAQLKTQGDVGAAMLEGLAGVIPRPEVLPKVFPGALPTALVTMPSQAEIDAILAIRKAMPHRELAEQLQQQIDTIKASMAGLTDPSLQAQARVAIEKLQKRLDELKALPGYAEGGIVPTDQVAMVHAGEMILPPDVSTLLQSLAHQAAGGGVATSVAADLHGAAQSLTTAATSLGTSAGGLGVAADAIDGMTRGLETGLERVLFDRHRRDATWQLGSEMLRVAVRDALASVMKDLQKGLASLLFGPNASSLGAGFSSLLFGPGGIGGTIFGSRGLSGLLGVGSSGLIGGAFAGSGFFPWLGGLFSGLFGGGSAGGLAAFLGMERGGVVPSAAGGWVVPSFQGGGILSMLHPNEMVLPSHISEGLQGLYAGGGGGHTFNLNVSAWDARSVMNAGPQLVAAINSAMRNGSMLRVPT